MSRRTVANVAWSPGRASAERPRTLLRESAAASPAAVAPSRGRYGSRYSICFDYCTRCYLGLDSGWTRFVRDNLLHPAQPGDRHLLSRDVAQREELYSQFIKEATTCTSIHWAKPWRTPSRCSGCIRWSVGLGWSEAIRCWPPRRRSRTALSIPTTSSVTVEDLYNVARESHVDPLKEFTEACREERKVTLKRL